MHMMIFPNSNCNCTTRKTDSVDMRKNTLDSSLDSSILQNQKSDTNSLGTLKLKESKITSQIQDKWKANLNIELTLLQGRMIWHDVFAVSECIAYRQIKWCAWKKKEQEVNIKSWGNKGLDLNATLRSFWSRYTSKGKQHYKLQGFSW